MFKLTTHTNRWKFVVASLALIAVAGAGSGIAGSGVAATGGHAKRHGHARLGSRAEAPSPAQLVPFATLSSSLLEESGVTLTETQATPSSAVAVASSGRAAQIASAEMGRTAREIHFAYCNDPGTAPPISEDCWAVSLDPSGFHSHGPVGSAIRDASYLLVLIDPSTGNVLLRQAGGTG
jgi:hypothetical protein